MTDRSFDSQLLPIHCSRLSFDGNEFEIINVVSKSTGLTSDQLLTVCYWLESEEISEENKLEFIECLIPEQNDGKIPELACIRLTYLLNTCTISSMIKVEILKWMICVYSFMETSGSFQMLYEYFFRFLKDNEMRPYAAHFIYLFTQKNHVTFARVTKIFRFIDEYGEQPSFLLILRIYMLHCPEFFEDELKDFERDLVSLGAYPSLIKKVHNAYEPTFSNIFCTTQEVSNMLLESSTVPHSFKAPPFHQLYKQYRALERTPSISEVLEFRFNRLFLTSKVNSNIQTKIQDHIFAMLCDDSDLLDTMKSRLELFRFQHSFPNIPEFTEFLFSKEHCDPNIAEVICYEQICCFKRFSYKVQLIWEKILTTKAIDIKFQWFNCLSKMFYYWILQSGKAVPCNGKCNKTNGSNSVRSESPIFHIPAVETSQLGSEIDLICDSLIMEDCNPFVLNQILVHYELTAAACYMKKVFTPCFPSRPVFQLALFSITPLILDTLGRLMLRIRALHDLKAHYRENAEFIIFQASCSDIKNLFLYGSYKYEYTYLAKTEAFEKLNEISSEFKNAFMLYKHPAFLLIAKEFDARSDLKNCLTDADKRLRFFNHLARNASKNFIKLLTVLCK